MDVLEDYDMEIEDQVKDCIERNNSLIKDAKALIDDMSRLQKKLHIKHGSGKRYLMRAKPDKKLLARVEQRMHEEYGINTTNPKSEPKKSKSRLLTTLIQRGMS